MLSIVKVDEGNRQNVVDALRQGPIRHVFAFYDLQFKPEQTTCHVAYENQRLAGYILIYRAFECPSVILECPPHLVSELLAYLDEDRFIMHSPPDLLSAIETKYQRAKHYVEAWMLVKRGQATAFPSPNVRRLNREDAQQFATLLSTRRERKNVNASKYIEWLKEQPMYGVFINGKLVSYAGSFIQTPQVWMIGGVYTHPRHRNQGYATQATSAITQQALCKAECAALFARANNTPAIKAYEKIGYRKIGEKIWTDQGTGLKP
jgi:RimJ/RimL family protein N-acetyltransferase